VNYQADRVAPEKTAFSGPSCRRGSMPEALEKAMSSLEGKEFSWYEAEREGAVVVRSVEAIAVYRNPRGDVVIRQESSLGDEDDIVIIPQSYVESLITALRDVE
jgi:hypothetical protein